MAQPFSGDSVEAMTSEALKSVWVASAKAVLKRISRRPLRGMSSRLAKFFFLWLVVQTGDLALSRRVSLSSPMYSPLPLSVRFQRVMRSMG